MIRNENFITIQGFMVNELKLKGNELLIYAIIYGFSQFEGQRFTGSLQYLLDWTGATSKAGIIKNLKSLISKGLIVKEEVIRNNVKFCEYYCTKCNTPITQSVTGYDTKCNTPITQSEPNNINNTINNNIDNNINKKKKEKETEIDALIKNNFQDEELINTVYEFVKMRKAIKKPLTTRGMELLIKKLYTLSTDIDEQIQILNNSIMNNWQGIFELKQKKKYNNKGSFDDFRELWEEAKKQDEQAGNSTSDNVDGW